LMAPHPPGSTLFPYTTLFRSGHADDCPRIRQPLPLEHWRGPSGKCRQRGKDDAQRLYQRRRLRYHRAGAPLSGAPDPGRRLPSLRERYSSLCEAEKPAGREKAAADAEGLRRASYFRGNSCPSRTTVLTEGQGRGRKRILCFLGGFAAPLRLGVPPFPLPQGERELLRKGLSL